MPSFSAAMGGLNNGIGEGVNLYNAISQGPIHRRLMEAQAQKAEAEAARKEMVPDEIDGAVIDPSLAGHKIPTLQALPWIAAKKQADKAAGMGMTPGRKAADMAYGKDYVD